MFNVIDRRIAWLFDNDLSFLHFRLVSLTVHTISNIEEHQNGH